MTGISPSFRLPGSLLLLAFAVPVSATAEDFPLWRLLGPQPTVTTIGDAFYSGAPVSAGRITSLVVDPRNQEIAYAGAALGGVWKTLDGGTQWTPLTDQQASLAIGSLALDPSNPDIIYAGTGEANFSKDSYYGAGILKSTDKGATWKHMPGPFAGPLTATDGGARIGALAVHATRGQILLAGVKGAGNLPSGIWRSSDGGVTWSVVLEGGAGTAVLFDSASPDTAYAGLGEPAGSASNGIYRSTDAGLTWRFAGSGITPAGQIGRISLAITATAKPVLFAAVANTSPVGPLGVYTSKDGAITWQTVTSSPPSYCYSSCFYTSAIQVYPTNPNVILLGGETFYSTRDGGTKWDWINLGANGVNIHADVHALAFSQNGERLYIGSDGGINSSEHIETTPVTGINFRNLNDTLALAQFYPGCSQHPTEVSFIICGTQDSGVQIYSGGRIWQMVISGDGGFTAIDDSQPSVYYAGNTQSVDVERTTPFGLLHAFIKVTNGLPVGSAKCSQTPPLAADPAHPPRMYWGCLQVYQTEDGGGLWKAISPDLKEGPGDPGYIRALAVSPSDSGRVYLGTSNGKVQTTANATAGTAAQWVDRSEGLPSRMITSIAVEASAPRTAYVSFAGFSGFADRLGHVFRTTDAGEHWTDISGSLPNTQVNAIALDPSAPGILYIGTDSGVFSNLSGDWARIDAGLPRSAVFDLMVHRPTRLLRAATHGRSMWEFQLPAAPGRFPTIENATLTSAAVEITGTGFTRDTVVRWNGLPRPVQTGATTQQLTATLQPGDTAGAGRATVAVCNPDIGCSRPFKVNIGLPPTITKIVNAANPGSTQLAPGTLASIMGTNLSPVTIDSLRPPWSLLLGGVTVEVHDRTLEENFPVQVVYVSPEQINVWLPPSLTPNDYFEIGVVNGTRFALVKGVDIGFFSPAIFAVTGDGVGQGWVILTGSGRLAGLPENGGQPAHPGETIQMYATGLGPVYEDESGAQPTFVTPQVTVGGMTATVTASVMTKTIMGLYQVEAVIPEGVSPGRTVPLVLTAGGVASNTVTIAVEKP